MSGEEPEEAEAEAVASQAAETNIGERDVDMSDERGEGMWGKVANPGDMQDPPQAATDTVQSRENIPIESRGKAMPAIPDPRPEARVKSRAASGGRKSKASEALPPTPIVPDLYRMPSTGGLARSPSGGLCLARDWAERLRAPAEVLPVGECTPAINTHDLLRGLLSRAGGHDAESELVRQAQQPQAEESQARGRRGSSVA